jgi:hypothetical protein
MRLSQKSQFGMKALPPNYAIMFSTSQPVPGRSHLKIYSAEQRSKKPFLANPTQFAE